jgi:hypothetical protein
VEAVHGDVGVLLAFGIGDVPVQVADEAFDQGGLAGSRGPDDADDNRSRPGGP